MTGQPRTVLIVDDDGDVRTGIADLLEDEGYTCLLAEQGLEALETLRLQLPSLILLDLVMPVMNGVEFLTRLRRDPRYRDIPTVVMTAANERVAGVKLETLDVPFLQKPVDMTNLNRILARYCPLDPSASQPA